MSGVSRPAYARPTSALECSTKAIEMTTTVTTSFGTLRGAIDRGVVVFRGLPYARAPVGRLRFERSQCPEPWTGVRDATTFGPPARSHPSSKRQPWWRVW